MYDRRSCEKPVAYHMARLKKQNRSFEEIKQDPAALFKELNIDLDVDELIENALKKQKYNIG